MGKEALVSGKDRFRGETALRMPRLGPGIGKIQINSVDRTVRKIIIQFSRVGTKEFHIFYIFILDLFSRKQNNIGYFFNTDKKFLLCDVPDKCYVWNKIYKTSELKKYNITFEPHVFFEDRCFTAETLIKLNGLVTVPDTYYNYWTNNKSTVKTKSPKKSKDSEYTYNKMMQYLKDNNINLDHYFLDLKKIKFLGLTILKIKTFKTKKQYLLFNCIKFEIKLQL